MTTENLRPRKINGKRVASPEYRSWQMMRNRCLNPRARDYEFYGGRGIKVCRRWQSFDAFVEDMGRRPSLAHTLERRNNDRGYTPANCYWATKQEQARNRSIIHRYNGKTVWEWAEHLGIRATSFHMRLYRHRRGEITRDQLFAKARSASQC